MYNRFMTKQKSTLTFPDGEEYTGELKDGNANGQGILTFPDGLKESGKWKDGKLIK